MLKGKKFDAFTLFQPIKIYVLKYGTYVLKYRT